MMNINTDPFPILNTERLILRKLILTDGPELVTLRSDEKVNRHLNRPAKITIEDAKAFVHKIDKVLNDKQGLYWAINLKTDPALIGAICYWNLVPDKGMAEIGFELLSGYHGRGLMQEAITAVIKYAFEVMGVKMIIAMVLPTNNNSIKLLTRNGFELDETYRFVSKEDAGDEIVYILTA